MALFDANSGPIPLLLISLSQIAEASPERAVLFDRQKLHSARRPQLRCLYCF